LGVSITPFLTYAGKTAASIVPGVEMHEPCAAPTVSASDVNYLVENAARCYRLARRLANPLFTRQLAELGQEYAAQAIAQGADPANLPASEEWRRVTD
jgi:hypothetical protein